MVNGTLGSRHGRDESIGENVMFDEYQQTQYDRVRELKEEIKSRARNFKLFKKDAKRQADEVEFNDFMSKKPSSDDK